MNSSMQRNPAREPEVAKATNDRPAYVPYVDICETGNEVHLRIEMPGVDGKAVEVKVENHVLTVEGRTDIAAPEGRRAIGREYDVGVYRRSFDLSDRVASEKIKAKMKDGVLNLTLPKRDEVKRRTVAIESE